ncbi:prepilin-type N-terminal cleavage/methylation domain-containing protein [Thermosynechococcus sp.]|uniref:prepilin-type N-terminal cleavage/methylation domain-containing protein n=1 Tax=Thermosynechococcus sp. TaxID=2814275 RepID=UPI003919A3B0
MWPRKKVHSPKQRRQKGFTIVEILVSLVIAGVIMVSLGSLLIDMLKTEREEADLNALSQELKMAMDVISKDLAEAVYIYDEKCLHGPNCPERDNKNFLPVKNFLPAYPETMHPILAMWILEPLPYDNNELGYYWRKDAKIPGNCNKLPNWAQEDCRRLQKSRHAYTLVVYYLDTAPNLQFWRGPAILRRYTLRKYKQQDGGLTDENLWWNEGYVQPTSYAQLGNPNSVSSFAMWPYDIHTKQSLQSQRPKGDFKAEEDKEYERYQDDKDMAQVLIDGVDVGMGPLGCPEVPTKVAPYKRTAPANLGFDSFYACVQRPSTNTNVATYVYLRLKPLDSLPGFDSGKRLEMATTVLSRSVVH